MSRRFWTDAERQELRALYATHSAQECADAIGRSVRAVIGQVQLLGLRKSPEWIAQRSRERSLAPDHGGRAHQFTPGLVPWNKGRSCEARGRSVETQFKPGRPPSKARNYSPIGSLRVTRDGILERKITDDHPVSARRWVAVHRLIWEQAHGPCPDKHIVVFKPGMRTTVAAEITLDRIELISRADNMHRNTIHNYPADVKAAIKLVKRAERALEKRCESRQHHRRATRPFV